MGFAESVRYGRESGTIGKGRAVSLEMFSANYWPGFGDDTDPEFAYDVAFAMIGTGTPLYRFPEMLNRNILSENDPVLLQSITVNIQMRSDGFGGMNGPMRMKYYGNWKEAPGGSNISHSLTQFGQIGSLADGEGESKTFNLNLLMYKGSNMSFYFRMDFGGSIIEYESITVKGNFIYLPS